MKILARVFQTIFRTEFFTQTSIAIRCNFNHSMTTDPLWILFFYYFIYFHSKIIEFIFCELTWNFIHFNLFNLFVINISTICTINSRNEFVISSRGFVNICTCFCFREIIWIFTTGKSGSRSRNDKWLTLSFVWLSRHARNFCDLHLN